MKFAILLSVMASVGILLAASSDCRGQKLASAISPAADDATVLTQEALRAEVQGREEQRTRKLHQALQVAPDHAAAHWHNAHVRMDHQWLTLEEANARAAQDKSLAYYRQLRATAPDTAAGNRKLATWCQRNGLDAEARAHWIRVLFHDRKDAVALKALSLRWHDGQWFTREELDRQEKAAHNADAAEKRWKPILVRLRSMISIGTEAERKEALVQLRAIDDPQAIPTLFDVLAGGKTTQAVAETLASALVAALGNIDHPQATGGLLRLAVTSRAEGVRAAAVQQLARRPPADVVPILLVELALPVEVVRSTQSQPDGSFKSYYSYSQETATGYPREWRSVSEIPGPSPYVTVSSDYWYVESPARSVYVPASSGKSCCCGEPLNTPAHYENYPAQYASTTVYSVGTPAADSPDRSRERQAANNQITRDAAEKKTSIDEVNLRITEYNQRIFAVLERMLGRDRPRDPKAWWTWWQSSLDEDPDLRTVGAPETMIANARLTAPLPDAFGRGTIVWTLFGPQAIEKIRIGDRVLSQDPQTGELTYQAVLEVAARNPSPLLRISQDERWVATGSGQPMWASGHGWRRACDLTQGGLVHGFSGSQPIQTASEASESESLHLVVDGFHTFFVGPNGLLAHDATTIFPPPTTLVPGLERP